MEFVNDLFNFKGAFERLSTSPNESSVERAYNELAVILEKYKKKMIHLEKQRLTKERVFYLREENELKY